MVLTKEIIGLRLKDLRHEMNLTQSELAQVFGIKRNTVIRWENAEQMPEVKMIDRLSRFFNVSIDYICGTSAKRGRLVVTPDDEIDIMKLNRLGRRALLEYYEFLQTKEYYKAVEAFEFDSGMNEDEMIAWDMALEEELNTGKR